ncbi:MAG TPA: protein kinase [Thermoleophilaceae bacterium]|nr:protein kinase [Thermoleophilaceae bacterium]
MTQTLEPPLGTLPLSGPIADFARDAEALAQPTDPHRPWVLAKGDRVVKVYDLRAFDAIERRQVELEAKTALEVSDVPGVVPTLSAETLGDWLLIEMSRMGGSLDDYLAATRSGTALRLPRERWASLFADVASTLGALHARGVVHCDIKPANLLVTPDGRRLLVADFSIASKRLGRIRRRDSGDGQVAGTDRFIAPERFRGRVGPAVDQYALGITVLDTLGDSDVDRGVRTVLQKATAQSPEDRYGSIDELGDDLRAALEGRARHGVSARLERVSPAWRYTWGPAAITAAVTYVAMVIARKPDAPWHAGLLDPLVTGAAAAVLVRVVSEFHGGRTQPRVAIAGRPWFPVAVTIALLALIAPLAQTSPAERNKFFAYAFLGAMAIWARLGATPPDGGRWLIRAVRRWEKALRAHGDRAPRRWALRLSLAATVLVAGLAPAATGRLWPADPSPPRTASGYALLGTVAALRGDLLAGQAQAACSRVETPTFETRAKDAVDCTSWAELARAWIAEEVAAGGPRFAPDDLDDVEVHYLDGSKGPGGPLWSLLDSDGWSVGSIVRAGQGDRVWDVMVYGRRAKRDALDQVDLHWRYEAVRRGKTWRITSVDRCDYTSGDRECVQFTNLRPGRLRQLKRDAVPR